MPSRDPVVRSRHRRERAARRVAQGLCSKCTSPATQGRMCDRHAEQNRRWKREHDARRTAAGICLRCPKRAVRNRKCEAHAEETTLYHRDYSPDWKARRRSA